MISDITQSRGIIPPTINLGTRVEDLTRVVGESRKVNTVFLRSNGFVEFSFFYIVGVNAFIITGADHIVALVIEVQRSHQFRRVFLAGEESLVRRAVSFQVAILNT